MQPGNHRANLLPVRVFELVPAQGTDSSERGPTVLAKFRVFLVDRPGSLAALSSLVAECGGNITFFHYDRAVHPNRVALEVEFEARDGLRHMVHRLRMESYAFREPPAEAEELRVTKLESVLEINVRLVNQPGSLAAFASLLADHGANVIYMLYDDDIETEVADIALATEDAAEVDRLLAAINERGYHYRVVYRGSEQEAVERVIGLNLLEKFFLGLRRLLSQEDMEKLRGLVRESRELCNGLMHFYAEAGNNLQRGEVFTNILTLASASVSNTGDNFHVRELPSFDFEDGTRLFPLQLPSGGNVFLFRHADELTMFDAGFGLYYADLKRYMRTRSLEPERVSRIFLSHADADHAGGAGYSAREFGAEVFAHPAAREVMQHRNRAHGTGSALTKLNRHFTRLVNEFTRCRYPEEITAFSTAPRGKAGAFDVIDGFCVGGLEFQVLESHGGHVPGQVFFLESERGLLFTADYILNVESLSEEEKRILSLPRYLMTSTNTNSRLFREESAALRKLASNLDAALRDKGRSLTVLPGHGDHYQPGSSA
jgi:glyoxylase-like metal-dependent hydrolase (beta-lactamase superfamily II)/uncharacterized protein with ACT and thioredoxin-like domain